MSENKNKIDYKKIAEDTAREASRVNHEALEMIEDPHDYFAKAYARHLKKVKVHWDKINQ